MLRRLAQIFFGIFAIFFAVSGIFLITFRFKLTNADFYKSGLENAGIFDEIDNIEKYFDADQDDVQLFLKPILNELDIKTLVKKTVFTNLDYLSNWINRRDDFYIYFPKEDLKNKITSEEFRNKVLDSFEENFSKLPTCENDSDLENFQPGVDGNYVPECKPSNFTQIFSESRAELESRLATILDNQDVVEQALQEAGYAGIGEKTSLDSVLSLIKSDEDKKSFQDAIETASDIALYTKILGFGLIVLSIVLSLLVGLFSKDGIKNFVINFSNIYILVGVLVTALSGSTLAVIPLIFDTIEKQAQNDNLQVQELVIKVLGGLESMINNIFQMVLLIGISLFIMFLLIRVLLSFSHKKEAQLLQTT